MICLSKPTGPLTQSFATQINNKASNPSLHLRPPNSNSNSNIVRKVVPFTKSDVIKRYLLASQKPKTKLFALHKSEIGDGIPGGRSHEEIEVRMWALCGYGFWVQGFRCFPWLALNFHMAHGLRLSPSALQLVQNAGALPMVAKPIFGVLSDAGYIGGAHRLPYISIGAYLQALSWGTLALIPTHAGTFPTQMACILFSNLGASITEVVSDALVAEFSKMRKAGELQSYAFTALASGALLGNFLGGFFLLKFAEPKSMFFIFTVLLTIQIVLSMTTKETFLYPSPVSNHHLAQNSLKENLSGQFNDLIAAITETQILYPLLWIVASNAAVPLLSGSMFFFQTQCLKLDPSVIGLSKVVGQLSVLLSTVVYNSYLKSISMRRLIFGVQVYYALSFLSDLVLVKQFNVGLGIPNDVYVLCMSSLGEAIAQFKTLPFTVLFSRLCPPGCEGSLLAFFASALCLSSIISGIFGVGLASLLGVSSGDYSSLPLGIVLQIVAALLPLGWISYVPSMRNLEMKKAKS